MLGNKLTKYVLRAFVGLLACLALAVAGIIVNCHCADVPPSSPVYPDSVLVEQHVPQPGTTYSLATYYYISDASPDTIVEYFRGMADCDIGDAAHITMCGGNAEPFGDYLVYIPDESASRSGGTNTSYTIEVTEP